MKAGGRRPSLGSLLPGDVLLHRSNERDVIMIVRIGARVDFYQLMYGRLLESWLPASAVVLPEYDVVRGESVLFASEAG